MTTAELLERASDILNDPEGVRWGSPVITAHMNTVQREFCTKTAILRTIATLSVDPTQTPATCFFTMPSDLSELTALKVDGKLMDRVAEADLPNGWESEAGAVVGYLFGEYGPTLLRLYRDPAAAVTVRASYIRTPKDLATNDPEVPEAWQIALVYGAVALCYLKDFEAKDPNKAAVYQQMHDEILADCIKRTSRSLDLSPRRSIIRPF